MISDLLFYLPIAVGYKTERVPSVVNIVWEENFMSLETEYYRIGDFLRIITSKEIYEVRKNIDFSLSKKFYYANNFYLILNVNIHDYDQVTLLGEKLFPCQGCKYFFGHNGINCAVHPEKSKVEKDCADFDFETFY